MRISTVRRIPVLERENEGIPIVVPEAGQVLDLRSGEVLEVLERYPVLRTDRDGWVEIMTDGEKNWISTGGN